MAQHPPYLVRTHFLRAFERFQKLVMAYDGYEFTNFSEGLAAVRENYKHAATEPA